MKINLTILFFLINLTFCFSDGKIPKVEREVLKNGITLIVLENPTPNIVDISGKIPAGSIFEKGDKKGIASAVAYLLLFGTKNRGFEEISETLDELGAKINFSAGRETIDFRAKCISDDFEKVGEILFEVIREPSFADEHLQRFKNITQTRILQMQDDPAQVAHHKFYNISYPTAHPFYSPPKEEMINVIDSYKKQDLVEFHQKHFCPQDMIISVVGNVKKDEVVKLLNQWTENFSCKDIIKIPHLANIPDNYYSRQEEIKLKDKSQTYTLLGHPNNLTREDPDFYALRVANYILADAPLTSRLYQKLREEKGYVYFVDGEFEAGKVAGPYIFTFGCAPPDKEEAIKLLKDEVKKIQKDGISYEELSSAVSFIVGSFLLRLETNEGMASTLTTCEYFNLGWDYPWKISKYYQPLTISDINNVLKKYVIPEIFTIITAGP